MNEDELKISDEESKRISIFKVWLSVMVVFIHSYDSSVNLSGKTVVYNVPEWLDVMKYVISLIVSRSAVPAFFFLASYFLYRKSFSWKNNVVKKFRSLMVPYFILNTFWIIVFFICQHIPMLSVFFSSPENIVSNWNIYEWIRRFLGSPSNRNPMLYPLWFIRDLFVLNLLSYVFECIVIKLRSASALLFIVLWFFLDSTHLFFLDIQALCFWGLGCYFSKHRISISSLCKYNKYFLVYPFLVVLVFLMRDNTGLFTRLIYRVCVLIGILFLYASTTKIKNEKVQNFMLFISKYSFCIFLFHEMNLTFFRKILTKLLPHSTFTAVFLYFGVVLIIITFCIGFSCILEKYTPRIYAVISGGRRK